MLASVRTPSRYVLLTILKALVGALVGLGIADCYYQMSLSDLHAKAEEQKNDYVRYFGGVRCSATMYPLLIQWANQPPTLLSQARL